MKYFTNRQVTELYAVSYDAVRKWIQAAQNGKVDLQIGQPDGGKWQIANTTKNSEIIEQLVARGKKHKNSRAYKVVQPRPEFYELYSPSQQLDIISSIEAYREIPLQYSYFDGGADYWDRYSQKLLNELGPNLLTTTIDLLDSNKANIDRLIGEYRKVNIVDLGVGNALPVRGLLQHLIDRNVLGSYIGIDISPSMLDVARSHIGDWFGDRVKVEMLQRDITTEGFRDLLTSDYLSDPGGSLNIVLMLGGTLTNLRQPDNAFRIINASMLPDDILLYTDKLDTANSRRYFDFNAGDGAAVLSDNHRIVIDLLNLAQDMYDVEQFYDELAHSRFIRIRMKIAVTLDMSINNIRRNVSLNKGNSLTLWHAKHLTDREVFDQLEDNDFDILNTSVTRDREYVLAMASVTASTK